MTAFMENLLIRGFDMILMYFFISMIFPKRGKISESFSLFAILTYSFLVAFIGLQGNFWLVDLLLYFTSTVLVLSLFAGDIGQKFLWGIYLLCLDFLAETFAFLLLYGDFVKIWGVTLQASHLFLGQLLFLFIKWIGLLVLVYLLQPKKNRGFFIAEKTFMILLIFPFSSLCLLLGIGTILLNQPAAAVHGLLASVGLVILSLNVLVLLLFKQLVKVYEDLDEERKIQQEFAGKADYYAQLATSQKEIRQVRHDMKNHLLTLNALLQNHETKKAQEYLQQLQQQISKTEVSAYTPNKTLNYVLSDKMNQAKSKDISVTVDCFLPEKFSLPVSVIAVIFGNLLDNAIEACEKIPKSERAIKLTLKYFKNQFYIDVQNTMDAGKILPELATSKKDKTAHGYGLQSVAQLVKENDGVLKIWQENNWFFVNIVLWDVGKQGIEM